jgi:phage shock protein A
VKTNAQVERIDDAIAKFEMYERRIDDLESQVDAYDLVAKEHSLSAEIEQLAIDDNIEKELQALRKKIAA